MKWNKFEEWFFEQKVSTQALVLSILMILGLLLVMTPIAIGYILAGQTGGYIGSLITLFIFAFIFNYFILR